MKIYTHTQQGKKQGKKGKKGVRGKKEGKTREKE